MIPYGKQTITDDDINAVIDVLKSDYLTQGLTVPLFENKLSKITGVNYATVVNSATSALHIACLAGVLKRRFSLDRPKHFCCKLIVLYTVAQC